MSLEGLQMYCQQSQSLADVFLSSLLEDEKLQERGEEKALTDLWSYLESVENPNREQDLANFQLINDLACDKGASHIRRICEAEQLEHLLQAELTSHGLALALFLNHKPIFNAAYNTFHLDYLEGWQVYAGLDTSAYKHDVEVSKEGFRQELLGYLRRIGYGQALHIDSYPEQNRLILDIKYAGLLTRQEDFDIRGNIQARTIRKPLEVGLAYYPEENVLKVKTPRGMEGLNEAIHLAFALNYLERPETLTNPNQRRWINLGEFKTRESFPFNDSDGIRTAKVTGLRLRPYQGSTSSFLIREKGEVIDILPKYNIDIFQATLEMVAIQFEFEGKGRGRFHTVEMTHKNRISTNNTERDAIIEGCLKRWGVLNG
jgi:hypothetical protein